MIDYKAEALAMCPNEPNHGGGLCSSCGRIAAALEAAEKRGRVAGLREAAQMMAAEDVSLDMRPASMSGSYASRVIERRAEEVEQS